MNTDNLTTTRDDVKAFFAGHYWDFYQQYLELMGRRGDEAKAVCPFHADGDPSFSVNNETGQFYCHGCKASGDAFQFYGKLKGLTSFDGIVRGIAADFNIISTKGRKKQPGPGRIVKTYDYVNAEGALMYQVVRMEPKGFRQRTKDVNGKWIWSVKDVDKVLYRLPELLTADQVIVVEGEKDVDNLFSMGMVSTTCVSGAGKWRFEYSKTLEGKDVVILPDNDEPGRKHAASVAGQLYGIASSVKVIEIPGLPEKGDFSDWIEAGGTAEALQEMVDRAELWEPDEGAAADDTDQEETEKEIRERFPRGPFPWGVLPIVLAESYKQLARSCATSATSLPGAAMAILASVIGAVVSVCPKLSWFEPLIFWFADIRASGEGKTHAARMLCNPLYIAQKNADEQHAQAVTARMNLPKKEREKVEIPPRPRGYFMTGFTLEGIHSENSGHGGCVCIQDEVSGALTGQNQYKAKGNDREAMIALHDGKPARIVRAGGSKTIIGARISLFGGCQPQVWKMVFTSEDGKIFQVDGTAFRFLTVYEGGGFYPLTAEAWSDENREVWEKTLSLAMDWANRKWEAGEKHNLMLSGDAQEIFFDWRNELSQMKADLPEAVRGFVPKLTGYALRFAGVLYLMDVFSRGDMPGKVLGPGDIRKGIRVSEFYMGHIMEAMKTLVSSDAPLPFEKTEQVVHLAETLERLRGDADGGLLPIGFIQEHFNKTCAAELHVKSGQAMGAIIRQCGLTIRTKKHWRDQHGVNCLKWDEKTDNLIKTCPQCPHSPQKQEYSGFEHEDNEKSMSSHVLKNEPGEENMRTMRTSKNQCPHTETPINSGFEDNEDNEDNISKGEKKINPLFDFNNVNPKPKEAKKPLDWSF
jgi:hypothetical protein